MTKEEWRKLDESLRSVTTNSCIACNETFRRTREALDSLKPGPTIDELIDEFHKKPSPETVERLYDKLDKEHARVLRVGNLRYEAYTTVMNCRKAILMIDVSKGPS